MHKHLSAPTLPEASQTVTKAEQIGPYDLRETLGVGAYAVVRLAEHRKSGVKAAVKIIPKNTQEMKMIQKELTIQRGLQHRNISRFLESRETSDCLYIFVEYAEGGELFDKIEPDRGIQEDLAHLYFVQLIAGVKHMHDKGVSHRDLKPENILLDASGTLKISDFGLATVFRHGGRTRPLETPCGSAPYVAPEVLQEEYCGDMVDIWSCGVILYVMMIGNTPWDLPSGESEEFSRYERDSNPMYEPWNRLQGPVRKLLLGILQVNPAKRKTIKEIMKDEWYKRPNPLVTDGKSAVRCFVNNPAQLASMLMENVNDDTTVSPIVAYSQPLQTERVEQSQYSVHDYRNYASSQPARNNERASDSSLGTRIAISWQTEALELSQPATQFTEATFLQVFSSERLTRFFSETPPDEIIEALDDAMVHNLVAHTVHSNVQKISISTTDQRRCFLTGEVKVVPYSTDTYLVMFDKSRGDPLEWKRMFKALVATLQDSENPIHIQMNP
ncbi:Chk1 protein kinase [Podila epigama]|nr:Chk1 protein kinase [Podila epigama]